MFINNPLVNTGSRKLFGNQTRLRVDASVSLGNGTGSGGGSYFQVGIRTIRISSVNLQPFVSVMGTDNSPNGTLNLPPGSTGSFDINIMDAMQHHYPTYEKSGIDAILAIIIAVNTSSGEGGVFSAVDGPGGRSPPSVDLGCAIGTSEATVTRVYTFEPASTGAGDREPPVLNPAREVKAPPDYDLPIITE